MGRPTFNLRQRLNIMDSEPTNGKLFCVNQQHASIHPSSDNYRVIDFETACCHHAVMVNQQHCCGRTFYRPDALPVTQTPQLWNKLPHYQSGSSLSSSLSSGSNPEPAVNLSHGMFHSRLKTYLFSKSFPP